MTSLAVQLAQNASLNKTLLVDRSRRKPRESYLFTGKEADNHDLHSLLALGINGLIQLSLLNPQLRTFEDSLFSEEARSIDRTLLPTELNERLNKNIKAFLPLLGPYLLESPTNKVLEWLVRRFRINEFNVEDVLALFLPYHETPHFAKMLTILHIKPNSTWSFLLPFKSAAQSVPRLPLVTEMLRNTDVARFVTSLLPSAVKKGHLHRVLLMFNAACLHDFIIRSKHLDEGTAAFLLPALLEPLESANHEQLKDAILGSYVLLAAFSQKCQISAQGAKAIVSAMINAAVYVSTRQFLTAIIAVCSAQEVQARFSEKACESMIKLPSIDAELRSAANLIGFDKVVLPLLKGLVKHIENDEVQSLISALLTCQDMPTNVLEHIAKLVLEHVLSSPQTELRPLLSSIYQRHPAILNSVSERMIQNDEPIQSSLRHLLVSLTLDTQPSMLSKDGSEKHDMIVASASADSNVRVIAVKELIGLLSDPESLVTLELESVHSALIARIQDTDAQVLDALYEKPGVVAPMLLKNAETFINSLAHCLCSPTSKPKRNILKIHVAFLAKHFCTRADNEITGEVFHKVLFPFLLFSKPRQHTAEMVWDIIKEDMSDSGQNTYELLHGCATLITEEKAKNEDGVQMMSKINLVIAAKIARNIMMSNEYKTHFELFVAKLRDENSHVQIMAHLIMHALIKQLSGEHQIDAAHKILETIGHEQLSSIESPLEDASELLQGLDGEELARHTVVKPSSKGTLHWLQLAIVAGVLSISPPSLTLDWTGDLDISQMNVQGLRHVELMRTVYYIANSSSRSPVISTVLLQTLFTNLKDDALAFLAGIWAGGDRRAKDDEQLRALALLHASAFLQAHVDENDGVDFQTIIPLVLIGLSSPSGLVRQAAIKCITQLQALSERQLVTVYKFDGIYGVKERKLQYLDQDDLKKYLAALNDSDHLMHDNSFLRLLHEQHLKKNKSDKRKESEYKRRVLCYLLSHVQALSLPTAEVILLKLVENVSDKAKASILSPIITDLIASDTSLQDSTGEDLTSLCLSSFDSSVADDLNEDRGSLWNLYIATIRRFFVSDMPHRLHTVVSTTLEKGLFVSLLQERKISLCDVILDIGTQDHEMYGQCKKLLAKLLTEVPLILHLLTSLQPPADAGSRASKRSKTDDADNALRRLTLLLEVLSTKPLPGSVDLISQLLDLSSQFMQSASPAQADVSYIEQLLMSAIDNVADKVTQSSGITPNAIRLDILVELIRVSDNPQTFHQALLLISKLSRLAPESALHNVMPVFTFMGSNVFHRDDTYSFKVVQQTIESIVPVMVASLKQSRTKQLDLYITSRDFLRVFTDAANHIPRHRRNNFFSHLVGVLGPSDFLAPVCMLLVGKLANRVVRQTTEEAQSTLALPIAIFQHNCPFVQMDTLAEILLESQRLVNLLINPSVLEPTLLDDLIDDNATKGMILKRRAKALISFVGVAIASAPGSVSGVASVSMPYKPTSTLISTLVSLASLDPSAHCDDIQQAAYSAINNVLATMPAASFVASALAILESRKQNIHTGVLDLLAERLPLLTDSVRQEATPTIERIVKSIHKLIAAPPSEPVIQAAFKALRSIAISLQPNEGSVVTDVLPVVLSVIKQQTPAASDALSALVPLSTTLGPRYIPFMRETVTICVNIISSKSSHEAYAILLALLKSVPTFWGAKELTQVISTYAKHWVAATHGPSQAMNSLVKAIAKHIPPRILLSSLVDMWPSYKDAPEQKAIGAYFDVITRALRVAERPLIQELLRQLSKIFLESFDLISAEVGREVKENVIASFKQLVMKLNEATFKPIFRRIYDWAYANDNEDIRKKVIFNSLYASLLDYFKALMTPYMSFLLQPITQDLKAFKKAKMEDKDYWAAILDVIAKSLTHDDGAFWRDDQLRQLSKPLVAQVAVCTAGFYDQRQLLQNTLNALVNAVTDDTLLKSINMDILMHTRSEDPTLRTYALGCSEMIWQNHGGKLLGFVAETATFIAECNEDENDTVVRQSLKLKSTVESIAGSIRDL